MMGAMLSRRIKNVEEELRGFVHSNFGIELGPLTVETPPRVEMGDLAFPFPFELARQLRRPPRQIAQEVAERAKPTGEVDRFEAAGAGYVNVFFNRASFSRELFEWLQADPKQAAGKKIIVEHTNINPNKAAHIGHLRNAALGDSFVRLLRATGHNTEVQNYIDNTGVQVADVVVGFKFLRKLNLAQVAAIQNRFDYYCWDLYAEVSEWFSQQPEQVHLREQVLKEIEEGEGETAELAEHVATRIVQSHLQTMLRIGVRYDLLPRESEILHLRFWEHAFQQLKQRKAIHLVSEGPNAGCWVMRLPGDNGQPDEEKIIVRSNGTVTYVGKDIAYQLWKFGLLGKTFHYRPFYTYDDGKIVWVTARQSVADGGPEFGNGNMVYNVIDVRQSYLQRVVVQGLRSLGYEEEADRSVHFAYEMVALSPACCSELGIELSDEDRSRPYVEVSGRKGLGVKADDLIDRLIARSRQEVDKRQPELEAEKRREIARKIATGALRYFLLKYARNSVIAFDFAEALSFEGETGPYLQYSVVRANNIFRKLWESGAADKGAEWILQGQEPAKLEGLLSDDEIWNLILHAARTETTLHHCIETLELSHLAKHAFTLAQLFNLFYHKYHILSEQDPDRRRFYLATAETARLTLVKVMDLLGIEIPDRM